MLKKVSFKIYFLLTLVFNFFTVSTFADSESSSSGLIDIVRSKNGSISLIGPSCQELTKQEQAIREWSEFYGEIPGSLIAPVEIPNENRCILNISNSVPSVVPALQDFKNAHNGPNCWNTALRLSGLVQFTRFSTPEELKFWLDSSYCRELSESEKSLPGDIIEIRAPNEEIHGMIYLSEDLVFSKNTSGKSSPYGIQRSSLIYQNFRVDNTQCKKVQGSPSTCTRWANHYRCNRVESDRNTLKKINIEFAALSAEVTKIESVISEYVVKSDKDYLSKIEKLNTQLTEVEGKIQNSQKFKGHDSFFYQALLHDVNSLKTQLEINVKESQTRK